MNAWATTQPAVYSLAPQDLSLRGLRVKSPKNPVLAALPANIGAKFLAPHSAIRSSFNRAASLYRNWPNAQRPLRNQDESNAKITSQLRGGAALGINVGFQVHEAYLSATLNVVNSAALRHEISGETFNLVMKTIEQIRRERLALLVREFGSYAELNEKMQRQRRDSTFSQYANQSENSRGGAGKSMGSPAARALEVACNKPAGWMDNDPDFWPLEMIERPRYEALSPEQRAYVQGATMFAIKECEGGATSMPKVRPASDKGIRPMDNPWSERLTYGRRKSDEQKKGNS